MYPLYALPNMLSSDFTSDFRFMIITILYLHISCFTTCILFHQFSTLILSYHEQFLLDITCYISTCSCMPVLTTQFLMHVYDSDLSIDVYLRTPLDIRITTLQGSSDFPRFSCPGPGAWSVWILPVAYQRCVPVAWILSRLSRTLSFQAPFTSLEFSFCKLVYAICTVHTCIPLCILAFAPIGDVISCNIYHIW